MRFFSRLLDWDTFGNEVTGSAQLDENMMVNLYQGNDEVEDGELADEHFSIR